MEKKIVPLKDLVPFDVFQTIFEKMMENEDLRLEGRDKMFEVGDTVSYMWGTTKKVGKIVGWEHDEGNVWEVTVTESMNAYFSDDDLTAVS
jgi:hypothetical protein